MVIQRLQRLQVYISGNARSTFELVMKFFYPFGSEKYLILNVIMIVGIAILLAIFIPNLSIKHSQIAKILSIAIYIIFCVLIIFWVIQIILSCKNQK